jgi:DNA-binding CsgD family transcriptional regulator
MPSPVLTDREVEILSLVAQGLTAESIASRLGISGRTVNFHKQNLRARLGVSTTVEAVAWLGRQGR